MHNGLNLVGGVWWTKSPLVTENEAGANFGRRFLNQPLIRRARAQNYNRNETVLASGVGEIKLNEARTCAIESRDLVRRPPAPIVVMRPKQKLHQSVLLFTRAQ